MNIKERLVRQSPEDVIYIGRIVKNAYLSEFGEVLNALIEALKTSEINYNRINPTDRMPLTADRILGRVEGYQAVINELELIMQKAEEAQKPIEDEEDA